MNRTKIAAGLAGLTILALAGCSTASASKDAPAPAQPSKAASAPATSAPASKAPATTGPLGTSFTVTTQDNSGNDVSYHVTAKQVLDPATGSDEFNTPAAGKRFVGIQLTILGAAGYSHDDANNDAAIMGSNGQTYTSDFSTLSAGTNFNAGNFSVSAGQRTTGWVTFQLPKGVSVASVQWQADVFNGNPPATWAIR
jgi:hypothetical protein